MPAPAATRVDYHLARLERLNPATTASARAAQLRIASAAARGAARGARRGLGRRLPAGPAVLALVLTCAAIVISGPATDTAAKTGAATLPASPARLD